MPLAALMIGSMSPDFSYFLMTPPGRFATHSLQGLFVFCLPVGLVIWLLFVRVLEKPTLALMPPKWAARIIPPHREWTFKSVLIAAVAVFLGGVTHILWDACTHADTFVTNGIPALQAVAFVVGGVEIRWYGILQHLSTLLGLIVLAVWATRKLGSPHASPLPEDALPAVSNRLRAVAFAFLVAATIAGAIIRDAIYAEQILEYRLFHLAMGGMTGFALAWLAIAVSFHLGRRPRHRVS